VDDRDAVGLVEFAGHFGQQLVGGHADRAGQPGLLKNGLLDQSRQHPATFALTTGYIGKVDVDLVDAAIFHLRGNVEDDVLESARVAAVLGKIDRQQDRLRTQPGGLHQTHGRAHPRLACRIRGGGDHAAPGIAGQPGKSVQRNAGQRPFGVCAQQGVVDRASTPSNHHGQPVELRVAQQLHRGIKGVHVQMSDTANHGDRE